MLGAGEPLGAIVARFDVMGCLTDVHPGSAGVAVDTASVEFLGKTSGVVSPAFGDGGGHRRPPRIGSGRGGASSWRRRERAHRPAARTAHTATELTRSDADENLDACRVRCHVCGARVYVGETAHDVEPGDDGVERFACAEHCETCR